MVDVFAVVEFEGGLFSAGSFVPVCIVTILPRRQPPLLSRYKRMSGVAVTSSRRCSLEVIRHDSRKGNFPSTSRGRDGENASGTPKANARALDSWDCWKLDRSRRISEDGHPVFSQDSTRRRKPTDSRGTRGHGRQQCG